MLGVTTPFQAELWGLRQALHLAKENEWVGITIENGCQKAINLINREEDMENHLCRYLIQDCMNLASETEVNLQHVLCEVNRCTDKMVKLGSKQNEKMVKILVPAMIWWIIC